MSDKWDMDEEYPPMLMRKYRPMLSKVVAEWLRAANLRCEDNKLHLWNLADCIQDYIIQSLKHGDRWLSLDEHHVVEDE